MCDIGNKCAIALSVWHVLQLEDAYDQNISVVDGVSRKNSQRLFDYS